MTSQSVDLVVFDLGRVLVKLGNDWPHACELAGVTAPASLSDADIQRQIMASMVRHETGQLADEDYFAHVGQLTGMTASQVRAIVTAWLVEPFADVVAIVEALADLSHVRTACLSNTNALHWQMMHDHPQLRLPLDRLDHAFASHIVGVMKPDAAIYQHVEMQTGCEPSAILFFDDHPANIAAAHGRGWQAVAIDITQPSPAAQIRHELAQRGLVV